MTRTWTRVAMVAVLQLLLVGLAVAPRLSAHALGEEYRLRVAPLDPVDPFRGAYVALDYPDLRPGDHTPTGDVYVALVPDGDGLWTAGAVTAERPAAPPYLACENDGWRLTCGIESFFADQAEALRLEREVADGAVATITVDDRGNAAVVDVG